VRIVTHVLVGVIVTVMTARAAGAMYYSPIPGNSLRAGLAACFVLATALGFALRRCRGRTLIGYLVIFGALVILWLQIPASNDHDWQPEVR
jgi:hypothetical protein